MKTAYAAHHVERLTSWQSTSVRVALKFAGATVLGSICIGAAAQTQESAQKQRLTVTCYWQSLEQDLNLHMPAGSKLFHDGCELYADPTHCERTVGDMLRDSKHDWERVTANGLIYTITCRKNCKEIMSGLVQHSYDAETDGKWMWITFEKPDKKDLIETFEVTDISPMKEQGAATSSTPSNPPPANSQQANDSKGESGISDADVEAFNKFLKLEPPQFCEGAPLLSKLVTGTMTDWKSEVDSEPFAEKIQMDSDIEKAETKLWKCSHIAATQDDSAAFGQALLALALVEQQHLVIRQSLLDDAVNSMTVLSSAVTVPAKPTVGQQIAAGIQGAMTGLRQWTEYQRQLRLARAQNQLHCRTTTWGRTTYTDCY